MANMKKLLILTLLFAALHTSAQIQFTAGINYESGVPSGAPSSTGSRLRVDLASGRIYQWSAANSTWRTLGQGIDIVAGCAAPAYTPGYAQSVFAVNGCNTPELYYYNGTEWKQVAGGGGGATYYAGTGIDIDANDTISIDTVPRLIFFSDQTYSGGIGAMRWNNDDGTLDLGLKGGNVTLQVGQELVQPVKHATNGGLDNGKVVYIVGSSGDNKTVLYARANSEATSANTFGLMTETVTGGNKGFCTTFGLVRNINTSNLTEGGAVWLSKDTAGAMTAVRPEAPNNGVFIGFCVRKHASTGVVFVNVQNGYELDELHNVYVPSPTNGQVLTYVSGNSRWEAATVADQSATNELQTLSVATNTATLSNSGGSVTIAGGGINTVGTAGSTITVTGTEVDGSTTNELQTLSVATNTATLSNSGGSVTIAGGGINSASTTGSTITITGTEVDGSITNEIQQIDTFSLSGQTLSASLSSDGVAPSTVTLPVVGITAGTNVTVSSTGGNFTINSTGGSSLSGVTGYVPHFNSTTTIDTTGLFWGNGSRLGIGTAAPGASLQINGEGITSGTSAFLLNNATPSELFRVANNGLISVGKNVSVSTQSSSQISATSGDANTNFVITPKGTGAIISGIAPDGSTGGIARGAGAIDLQASRTSANDVASGAQSGIFGGLGHRASGAQSGVFGGSGNTASNAQSATIGGSGNNASGIGSVCIGGSGLTASSSYTTAFGVFATSNLYGAQAYGNARFGSTSGTAQTMSWRYMREISGTGIQELTLDNAAPSTTGRAILVANRAWNVRISVTAICSTAGGTVTLGDSFIGEYIVLIKRIVNTTTLIGTVQSVITAQSDASMSSSIVTITADDTNECLKVEFTPPTTAAAGTVIRVIATATATVAGY